MSLALPLTGMQTAMRSFPASELVASQGWHTLWRVTVDWFALVGPACSDEDTGWCLAWLPVDTTGWSVVFETYGDTCVQHFARD